MFDLSDTEPIPGIDKYVEENQLLERWDSLFDQAQGNVGDRMWDNLMFNLPQYGIRYDDSLIASNVCGGYLESTQMHDVEITISRDCKIKMRGRYVISVNRNQSRESAFCTICHELGHLFCYHLFYDDSKTVTASPAEKEFEAETVAWIVSKRIGIKNLSEEYLESYSQNGEIPYCSLDHIMKAVTEIEKMLNGRVSIKKSLWYANDKLFRDEVDGIIRSLKHGS